MAWKAVGILTVLLGLPPMTAPLSAHHSRAMFDVNELVSVEGVVTKVEWRNPHMWVTLDVPAPNGKTETWGFEGSGAASMEETATIRQRISRSLPALVASGSSTSRTSFAAST